MLRRSPSKALTEFHTCIAIAIGVDRLFQTVHYLYISDLVEYKALPYTTQVKWGPKCAFCGGSLASPK